MSGGGRRRLVRLFGASIADQIVLSAANFVVGFVLIRFASDKDYGLYVLIQSALLFATSASSAWISGPLTVLAPRKPTPVRDAMIGTIRRDQRRMLLRSALLVLPLPVAGLLVGIIDARTATMLWGCILAGWMALRREYVRNVLLIISRPHNLLVADSFYCGALLAGMAGAVLLPDATYVCIPIALAIAAWIGTVMVDASVAADPGWITTGDSPAIWRELRTLSVWSLVSAVIYWLFTQSYNYVLAARLDLKAVADVNATRLLQMPMIVLTVGIGSFLPTTAANWYAEVGYERLRRRLIAMLIPLSALYLVYFGVVWYFRDWLVTDVLHKQIADRDRLLLLWAALALAGLFRDLVQAALFAVGRLKSLAGQLGVSAAISLAITAFGIPWWGAAAALAGQVIGEIVNLCGITIMLSRGHHAKRH